jgi:hypothetical protein
MSAVTLAARVAVGLDIFPALATKTTSWVQKREVSVPSRGEKTAVLLWSAACALQFSRA